MAWAQNIRFFSSRYLNLRIWRRH